MQKVTNLSFILEHILKLVGSIFDNGYKSWSRSQYIINVIILGQKKGPELKKKIRVQMSYIELSNGL